MTAFLKIDRCKACDRALPWEWTAAVYLSGKRLAGTGVWRSQLLDGRCPDCEAARQVEREREKNARARRASLVALLGGEKPYREFTFDRFRVTPGNRLAFEFAKDLNPATDNLYLWGPCGVGKTHLAWATARRAFEETLNVAILRAAQLTRQVRMREPSQEQAAIEQWIEAELLILDDLGSGNDTAFNRQILQEVVDGRVFHDRSGLVITSKYALSDLAYKFGDDAIPSRLAGMCRIVQIQERDGRLPS